jgi:PIN like domain
MGDPKRRSKKRSIGKRPLKNFTLYLDQSFDCEEVKVALSAANIKFRVYTQDFKPGEDDTNILPLCGQHGWAMLTIDRKNRYRGLERQSIMRFRVRQFIFTANLGGAALAQLLVSVYQKMRKFALENSRPFVAVITKNGDIYLRMDHRGNASSAS